MEAAEGSLTPFQKLQIVSGKTMATIRIEVAGLINPLLDHEDTRGISTLGKLFILLFDRAKATRVLIGSGMDWDAEIVLRAFYETSAKILLLCVSPEDEKAGLLHEYWIESAETHNRRKRNRAALVEKATPPDEMATAIFSFLQSESVTPISDESTKARRRAVEHKWSFTEIIEYLSRRAHPKFDLGNAKSLLHVYGMASHFVHADHNALDLMEDRAIREPSDRALVEAAHASRILTDQVSLAFLCTAALSLHLGVGLKDRATMALQAKECLDVSAPIMSAFYESQKSFYEGYGYQFTVPS